MAVLTIVILLTTVVTLFSVLRTPSFQQMAGRVAANFLTRQFHSEVFLDKLRISDLLYIEILGLQLNDNYGQEMIRINDLRMKINRLSLKKHVIKFERVSLDSAGFFLKKYPGDSVLNFNYFLRSFQPDTVTTSDTATTWSFFCDEFTADDLSFRLCNNQPESLTKGIDFDDLSFSEIFLNLKNIAINGDSVAAFVKQISCREQSGIELLAFSGDVRVSQSGIRVKKALINTGKTTLDLDLDFLYNSYNDLSEFLDSVYINSIIRSSVITLSDIGYFAPELFKMDDPIMISGLIEGPVSDFTARDFIFNLDDFTEFKGDISMKGLPDIDSTCITLDIAELTTTPEDISAFDLPMENPNLVFPSPVRQLGITTISGKFEGWFDDFKTDLDICTDVGNLKITGSLSGKNPGGELILDGNILGTDIQLGKIIGSEDLGLVSLELEFSGKGSTFDNFGYTVNGWLQDLEFRNYRYAKIIIGGEILARSFNGQLMVLDSSLNLGFKGLVDFNGETPLFDFTLDLENARFFQLNLSDRSEDMDLKAHINGDFKGINAESFYGEISIDSLRYVENDVKYWLDHLELSRNSSPGRPEFIRLRSDYIDGDMTGEFSFNELIDQLTGFILGKEGNLGNTGNPEENPQFVSFNFELKDISPVTGLFMPFLEISPGTVITGQFDSGKKSLVIEGLTDEITVSGIRFKDVNFSGRTDADKFDLEIGINRIILQENEDGTGLGLDNFNALISSGNDSIYYAIKWSNNLPESPNNGAIEGFARFASMKSMEAGIFSGEANFNGNLWRIGKDNLFTLDSSSIGMRNFNIFKDDENFVIDGKLTDHAGDTLSLYFKNWSMANFNPFIENLSLKLSGIINGRFGIFKNESITNFFAGIIISDFSFNEVFFGDAEFKTHWLEYEKAMAVDLNIFSGGNTDNPFKILGVNGYYYPFDKKRNFDFDITAQNLNISVLEPLLTSFSSHLGGFATGKLTLHGSNAKPSLAGRLKLQRSEMKIDYLNVVYSFSNEVVFSEDLIQFSELKVFDPNSNTALLHGGIRHNYFQDMSLDLTIKPDHFMAMDIDRYQNEFFYGKAIATGNVRLYGPFSNISIDVDVKTEKGTDVSIPINYSVDVSQNDFIVFTHKTDTMQTQEERNIQIVGVSLDIGMDVTRDANIEIYLPGNIGNIRANGDGNLRLGVDPNGYLMLDGLYVIQSGLFSFSLEQLVSRRFDILEGSRISWTGDIYDAEVNIVARYRLRTSLDGLGISMFDPGTAGQKVMVNTDIRMTGNLFNPDLSFGISFPNMQEQSKQAVYAVLDTTDNGIMNQQAISLLVLGSFSNTGVSGSNPVNPATIVSSTLSNMLSQISNDFNIGINYMPGDQVTSEQLEVALSTQLLDDRLIIDGNIDVSGSNASSQKTSSIVGDINVEYKLTPDGRFRVKAFNRSNDLSLFNDYSPYTQGVGIFYRKEFNNLGELFRSANSTNRNKVKK